VQLLGGAPAQLGDRRWRLDQLHAVRLGALPAGHDGELDLLAALYVGGPGGEGGLGKENVPTFVTGEEPVALLRVKPLHSTRRHR
jgi:hypothetical protein